MQAPGTTTPLAPARFANVVPEALEASEAVTSEHASTFEISVAAEDGVGEWPPDVVADGLDEPHALTRRPTATRAIAPLARTVSAKPVRMGALPERVNLGPVVSQGDGAVSTGPNGKPFRR
jgi:hypothetical protein